MGLRYGLIIMIIRIRDLGLAMDAVVEKRPSLSSISSLSAICKNMHTHWCILAVHGSSCWIYLYGVCCSESLFCLFCIFYSNLPCKLFPIKICLFLSKKLNISSQDKLKGICDISELLGVEMVTRDGVSLRGIKNRNNQTKKGSLDSERVKGTILKKREEREGFFARNSSYFSFFQKLPCLMLKSVIWESCTDQSVVYKGHG